jgi:hypothetical protein
MSRKVRAPTAPRDGDPSIGLLWVPTISSSSGSRTLFRSLRIRSTTWSTRRAAPVPQSAPETPQPRLAAGVPGRSSTRRDRRCSDGRRRTRSTGVFARCVQCPIASVSRVRRPIQLPVRSLWSSPLESCRHSRRPRRPTLCSQATRRAPERLRRPSDSRADPRARCRGTSRRSCSRPSLRRGASAASPDRSADSPGYCHSGTASRSRRRD